MAGLPYVVPFVVLAVALVCAPRTARAEETNWATTQAAELTQRGRDRATQGDAQGAVTRYLEAIRFDVTYAPAYLALGGLYEGAGELKEAERTYAMGIEHVAGFAEGRLARAHLLASERRMPEAIVDLESAAISRPDELALWQELARAYVAVNALPAALSVLRRVASVAEARGDASAHDVRIEARALSALVADVDPVTAARVGRGNVRRAIALFATRTR